MYQLNVLSSFGAGFDKYYSSNIFHKRSSLLASHLSFKLRVCSWAYKKEDHFFVRIFPHFLHPIL